MEPCCDDPSIVSAEDDYEVVSACLSCGTVEKTLFTAVVQLPEAAMRRYDHTKSMKMPSIGRVTITLPVDLVRDIDRREKNRSKFVADAVRNELDRRRREDLRRSLQHPHPESAEFVDEDLAAWTKSLPSEDAESLVDTSVGTCVRWVSGEGWVEEKE